MSPSFRCLFILLGALSLTLLAGSPSSAFEALWSTVLPESALSASDLRLSLLDLAGGTGLQFATAGTLGHGGTGIRVGFGFDDMVPTPRNALDGAKLPVALSDRLFLLTTPCDKRFQLTIQFTW